jgi:starch synthase (maltosyl-transferring)
VVTLNPYGTEEATVWLDLPALGMEWYDRFWVRDEITNEEYQWGNANYVRLDPAKAVAHILNLPRVPDEALLPLLRRE